MIICLPLCYLQSIHIIDAQTTIQSYHKIINIVYGGRFFHNQPNVKSSISICNFYESKIFTKLQK